MVVWEESVGAKLVINYQQLPTIDGGQSWSTINNHYQQLTEDKIGQQLPTIAMIMGGQQLTTIINNCRRTKLVNHTAKRIVPFRAKN